MTRRGALLVALLAVAASAIAADTYTCVGADGRKTFSDRPCPGGVATEARRAAPGTANSSQRHGLTYGLMAADGAPDAAVASCHAQPAPADRPRGGSCDPYRGDTACTRRLPLLCFKPGEPRTARAPMRVDAATGSVTPPAPRAAAQLGRGPVVEGLTLAGEDAASRQCEQTLGAGWRIARFHDEPAGWQLTAERHASLAVRGNERYWLAIGDQPGNCWNAARDQRPVPAAPPVLPAPTVDERELVSAIRQFRREGYAQAKPACRAAYDRLERQLPPPGAALDQGKMTMEDLLAWLELCTKEEIGR